MQRRSSSLIKSKQVQSPQSQSYVDHNYMKHHHYQPLGTDQLKSKSESTLFVSDQLELSGSTSTVNERVYGPFNNGSNLYKTNQNLETELGAPDDMKIRNREDNKLRLVFNIPVFQ